LLRTIASVSSAAQISFIDILPDKLIEPAYDELPFKGVSDRRMPGADDRRI
jgi:hypothetical protein